MYMAYNKIGGMKNKRNIENFIYNSLINNLKINYFSGTLIN